MKCRCSTLWITSAFLKYRELIKLWWYWIALDQMFKTHPNFIEVSFEIQNSTANTENQSVIISYHCSRRSLTWCYSWWQTIFRKARRSHNLADWAHYQPSSNRLVPPLCSHHHLTLTNPIPFVSLRMQHGCCPLTDQQAPSSPASHSQRPNRLVLSDSVAVPPTMFWNCWWGSTDRKCTQHHRALVMQKCKIMPTFTFQKTYTQGSPPHLTGSKCQTFSSPWSI